MIAILALVLYSMTCVQAAVNGTIILGQKLAFTQGFAAGANATETWILPTAGLSVGQGLRMWIWGEGPSGTIQPLNVTVLGVKYWGWGVSSQMPVASCPFTADDLSQPTINFTIQWSLGTNYVYFGYYPSLLVLLTNSTQIPLYSESGVTEQTWTFPGGTPEAEASICKTYIRFCQTGDVTNF